MSALRVLPGGGEGGTAPWTGRLVPLDLAPAAAGALRRARLHAVDGGGEVTDGRAVLRVAG